MYASRRNLFMINFYFSNFLHTSFQVFNKVCRENAYFWNWTEITVCFELASIWMLYLCIIIHFRIFFPHSYGFFRTAIVFICSALFSSLLCNTSCKSMKRISFIMMRLFLKIYSKYLGKWFVLQQCASFNFPHKPIYLWKCWRKIDVILFSLPCRQRKCD